MSDERVPCSRCGLPCHPSRQSRAGGLAACRDCRDADPGYFAMLKARTPVLAPIAVRVQDQEAS